MPQSLRSRTFLAALVVAASVGSGHAAAEPRLGAGRSNVERRLVELKRQARELQEKIRRMEAELEREARAEARAVTGAKPPDCRLPLYMDSAGIKHFRAECLEGVQPSCDVPFMDPNGVRRMRPKCDSGRVETGARRGR